MCRPDDVDTQVAGTFHQGEALKGDGEQVLEPSKGDDPSNVDNRFMDNNKKDYRGIQEPREGKRRYERMNRPDQTNRIRKGGSGPHSWGSPDDIARANEGPVDENDILAEEDVQEMSLPDKPAGNSTLAPENAMTYKEYMASKESKK